MNLFTIFVFVTKLLIDLFTENSDINYLRFIKREKVDDVCYHFY